ncbi:MAG TPA: MGMT family protein, partial [Elusimicrobiota bacterium]|nr:MGMT family protein [Elusimicrobiota bacterium]
MKIPKLLQKRMASYPRFYQAVWRACAQIPRGETRTYGWIAKKIGIPRAARAVGMALAANPFAPVIPCHRVIRADGSLGGYSGAGGLKKKRRMLAKESSGRLRFNRTGKILTALLLASLAASTAVGAAKPPQPRPNV